ncbi:hypothetical protein DXG01_009310 [Tephrocybe rancida]|nr:hypothetical protein DXG01_009310 [Tephrocybe rancida]
MFRANPMTRNAFVNHRAHVPILMLEAREEYGSVSVDMNINNATGAQGVEAIKGYLEKMPALRPLVLLLKSFLRQRKLNDASKGGLGSYALVCLCIHFLQANPSKRPQEYIDKPMEAESLGFLLTDFMFYYGFTFPYKTSYISTATSPGAVLEKAEESELLSIRCLFNPGLTFFLCAIRITLTLLELSENEIAKSVSKVEALLQVFKDAYATLLQLNLADNDTLGQIIRVNKKFIEQRARLSTPTPPANTPNAPRTHRPQAHYNPHHSLPPHPPAGNIPRAPRTWKETPMGPARMQHPK